ncbi:DUF7264 domain-containing protein [Nocardia arthritidis]|uniref:LtfC/p132/Gp6 beta-sandwich domain-containing protein n=1 Tax=Nocardia arthritidis TaxID=228602 RepID=A0A6G9YTH7_9NOCA|nr:hypothetical protein [Nocardia arthritidis]QIS16401.1 hypothetical protein F5544_42965 [Nocardia arthritidis]
MTDEIGRTAPVRALNLISGDDFKWGYRWENGVFPTNVELYLEFRNGPNGGWGDKWQFAITGDTASIRVQSEVADAVPNRLGYRLIYRDKNVTPTDETVLCYGAVKRGQPR